MNCDGTRAGTDFVFRRIGRVHLNRWGASVQSTTGSRGVRISGSNAGYTTFRGSVKSTGYPLHSPVSHSLPLPCVTICYHISTGVYQIRPALLGGNFTQNRVVILSGRSGTNCLSLCQGSSQEILTHEDETVRLFLNIGMEMLIYSAHTPRRAHISLTSQRKSEITRGTKLHGIIFQEALIYINYVYILHGRSIVLSNGQEILRL